MVSQGRIQKGHREFNIGKLFDWNGRCRQRPAALIIVTAALDREPLQIFCIQTQTPRLAQQRRKVCGGSEFSGQGWRIHRTRRMPQNWCGVNVFRDHSFFDAERRAAYEFLDKFHKP